MHKTDLVAELAVNTRLSDDKADLVVAALLEQITNALSRGEAVTLPGFGSFVLSHRAARSGRHPRTGEAMNIAAHTAVVFRSGKTLKTALNTSQG